MSFMFEIYYARPRIPEKEQAITDRIAKFGGALTYHEEDEESGVFSRVILTYEFDTRKSAEQAATAAREQGLHVEGPSSYEPGGQA